MAGVGSEDAWCDERIAAHLKDNEQVQRASQLMGIGPVSASAVVATVCDFKQEFGAWLGLTPRQNSSGGKSNLGGITKRGDMYVRMLLIQGAKSAIMPPTSAGGHQLREKSGWQKAAVALANKNARILWAMFARGKPFDAFHVSVKPGMAGAVI